MLLFLKLFDLTILTYKIILLSKIGGFIDSIGISTFFKPLWKEPLKK